MKHILLLPTFISSLRIAALPLFFYLFSAENMSSCLLLLSFCAATDFLDGYIARRLNSTSRLGAYYDATTDFLLMLGIFLIFYAVGYYPIWFPVLVTASFIQFLVTSAYSKKLYDPIGKYLGSALYIGIILTLLFPTQVIFNFVQFAFVGFFIVSIASRIISLTRKKV